MASPRRNWSLIRQLLRGRDEATLQRARLALADLLGAEPPDPRAPAASRSSGCAAPASPHWAACSPTTWASRSSSSTASIERLAGCDVHEIHSLYGSAAYRRYEQRALEETVAASPGRHRHRRRPGVRAATFDLLLASASPSGCARRRKST